MQYFKKYSNKNDNNDIKRYCEKLFNIQVDHIYKKSDNEIEDLKQKYEDSIMKIKPLQKLKRRNFYKWLGKGIVVIVIITVSLFIFIEDDKYEDSRKPKIQHIEEKKVTEAIKTTTSKNKTKKSSPPKIKAVVANEILIANDWHKVGDNLKGYKVKKITKEYVEFEYAKKLIKVYRVND